MFNRDRGMRPDHYYVVWYMNMKLSQNTIKILKNFSTINSSIQFRKGDTINTISSFNDIIAEARLDESFPVDCAIYDLPKFLGIQTVLNDPDLEFNDNSVEIRSGNRKYNYGYADSSNVKTFSKKVKISEVLASVTLSEEDQASLFKGASILSLPDLKISSDGKKVTFTALNAKNNKVGTFVVETDQKTAKFSADFKFEQLKIIEGGYEIDIASRLGNFKHSSGRLQYWITVAADEA